MTRLTNTIKDRIVHNAITKSDIPKRKEELKLEFTALAEKVRVLALGGQETADAIDKAIKDINKITSKFDTELFSNTFHIRHGIHSISSARDMCEFLSFGDYKPSPYQFNLSTDHEVVDECLKLQEKRRELDEERNSLSIDVRAVLNSVTTIKKLIEVWPEVVELLPKVEAVPSSSLPAVLAHNLNKTIGLPTETKDV